MIPYRNYLLAVLAAIGVLNGAEGTALGLVLQDLKHDFHLTDARLGLVTGFAFALFYSVGGLAMARWADRGNRVVIVSLTTAAWGLLLVACAMATNFSQLVVLRVGLGIGEAGFVPVYQSLIADYFGRVERLRANAVFFAVSAGVGPLVGYCAAGTLNEAYGWRVMFTIFGLSGLTVAIAAWLTLREPRLEKSNNSTVAVQFPGAHRPMPGAIASAAAPARLREIVATLWSNATFRHLMFFWPVWGFVASGLARWLPAFFVRSYGLHTGELGIWLAAVFGLGGGLGPLLGGMWCARYAANNERLQLRAMALTSCGLVIFSSFIYLAHDYRLAFGLLCVWQVLMLAFIGTFWAIVQTLVPRSICAAATAILLLLSSLIGAGLGPLVTGALSDTLRAQLGDESLLYASLALCPGYLWAAWHLWRASKSVTADLAVAQEQHDRRDCGAHGVRTLPDIAQTIPVNPSARADGYV